MVAELFVPRAFPPGEYVFGFTLADGRSADAVFRVPESAAAPRALDTCSDPPRRGSEGRIVAAAALQLATDFAAICAGRHYASDASIAVGLTELLVATNDAFALYDKSGRLIDRVDSLAMFSSFGSATGYGWGDPRALFDRQAQRYFLAFTMLRDVPGRGPCECDLKWLIAVSRTSAPKSLTPADWHMYVFDGTLEAGKPTASKDGDFLVLGTDTSKLVLHANMASSPAAEQTFTKLWVFDKARLLAGVPTTRPDSEFVDVRDPLTGGSLIRLLPAAMNDDPGRVMLVGRGTSGCSFVVGAISGPAENAILSLRSVPIAGACASPPHSPQLGGGTPIWSVGDVMGQPSFARGRLWLTHAVAASTGDARVSAIRVVQIDVSLWPETPKVVNDTTLAERGTWYSFPALAANARGDVAIVATRSSFKEYGSVWYTGRLASDPPGALRPTVLLKSGEAALATLLRASQPEGATFNKFADFSGAAVDPSDGTVWLIGSYVANVCAWGTWVGHVDWSVAPRDSGTPLSPPAIVTGPPCSAPRPDVFTLRFASTEDGSSYPSRPAGTLPYLFTYTGAELRDASLKPVVTDPQGAIWSVPRTGSLVVFLSTDMSPGAYQFRIRLADGRSTGAYFTVLPP